MRCTPICLAACAIASPLGTYRLVPMSAPPDDTQPLTLIHPISWMSPSRSPRKPLLTASTV